MKKSLWLFVSIITFSIGIVATLVWFFANQTLPQNLEPLPLLATEHSSENNRSLPLETYYSKGFPGLSQKIADLTKGKSGDFQDRTWKSYKIHDAFVNEWYGTFLKAMGEKSLLNASNEDTEIYRFLWLRSFDRPIFVRIERKKNKFTLFTKELDGAGGYEPGKVLRSRKFTLKKEEFTHFLQLLEQSDYWTTPSEQIVLGADGAEWILEGVKMNRYHIVDRWSPEEGDFREACIYLLRLSGVDIDKLGDDLY